MSASDAGPLAGRTALVAGASSGIGLATATLLADSGARVYAGARRAELVAEGAGPTRVAAGTVFPRRLDVADRGEVASLLEEIDGAGRGLDLVVLAAGVNVPDRRIEQLTGERFDHIVGINLTGAFNLVAAVLPHLRASRGTIILIGSVSGSWPDVSGPAYQASKAGLLALGRGTALEEHTRGVRVTSILPGIVDTPILDNRPQPPPPEVREAALQPEDVAAACLFVATLPPRAAVPELTILPNALQALGNTGVATPPLPGPSAG